MTVLELAAQREQWLWKWYTNHMQIVNFPSSHNLGGARGICLHCGDRSYFHPLGAGNVEGWHIAPGVNPGHRISNVAQCQGCKELILVIGKRKTQVAQQAFELDVVYPLGRPNDTVDAAVPTAIADDFKEALRSFWVGAHKATVAMCRRAIQATALDKGASARKNLNDQIDELATQGR